MSVGVTVSTEAISGRSASSRVPNAQLFITGLAERGDVEKPMLVRSFADVKSLLGSRVSYGVLYDQLNVFFSEGGQQAYINRVVGPAATKGTLTLQDRAGSPIPTLVVNAQNPGAWSSGLSVQVANGTLANTFRIIVTYGGVVVHDENNIANPADALLRFSNSNYVRLTNSGSATVAPGNNPAVVAATALTAGADDRAAITDAHWVTAMQRAVVDLGSGCVAAPGRTGDTFYDSMEAYCEGTNRIALLAEAEGASIATLQTAAALRNSEYSGLFAPWLVIDDGAGGTRNVSPEGFVAAARARAHQQVGPWRAPAGSISKSNFVVDVVVAYTAEEISTLSDSKVNAVKAGQGDVRLYGWKSTSEDTENWLYLVNRDLLNYLVVEGTKRLDDYVFAPIDSKGHVLSQVSASMVGLVEPIRAAGGIFERIDPVSGQEVDPGYKIVCDESNNPVGVLSQNEINVELSVRVSPVGALIRLKITKVGVLGGL